MTQSRNIYDLFSKIEWEGSIADTIEYGVRNIDAFDVPDELKEAWEEMVDFFDEFHHAQELVEDLLEAVLVKYETDKEF
jgi:hypothetical protein